MTNLQIFNEVLSGFQGKPINIFAAGAENLEYLSYLLEYVSAYGGRIVISDEKVESLKSARNVFSNLLDKHNINFYLGPADNFVTSEWDFIFFNLSNKEEFIRSFNKIDKNKSLVVIDFSKIYVPAAPLKAYDESKIGIFNIPGQNSVENAEYINNIHQTNKVIFNEIEGERFLVLVPYGDNRDEEVTDWHKKVMQTLKIKCNYFKTDAFSRGISHGLILDYLIKLTKDLPVDYWMFLDNDSTPLINNYLQYVHTKVKDHETLYSPTGQSNHKLKEDGTYNRHYGYGAGMVLSKKLFEKLGNPSLHEYSFGDTAEILTDLSQQKGFNTFFLYPSKVDGLTDQDCLEMGMDPKHKFSQLGNNLKFGFGTTYGQNIFYHQYFQNCSRSKEEFIKKAKEIINSNN